MINIIAILMIGFILGVNLENYFSDETYRLFLNYEKLSEESFQAKDNLIISLQTKSKYYKKAYEDTILDNINLMKIMNRRK